MKKLLAKIRKILHDRRTRQMLTRIVSVTAAIVVFITTYALVLPAITMESEANCGIEAHQHDESCYEDQLICGEIESPGHHHSEACYEVSKALVCEEQEHQHDDSCFDESGNLTCDQLEHTHDDTCYKESRELTCDIPESDGHQHSSACYERVLTCGKEIHTHSTACYEQASDTAASASVDFAAVATTELGSSGATVSASTEIETESGESDAASSETSDAWTTEKNVEGEASSSTATNVSTTAATTAGSSSTAAAAANTATASTGNTAFDSAAAEDTYIPQLEPVIFEQLLTKDTGIYYYHAEEGQEAPESSADIADWKRVNDDTELAPADLLRVYLRYTIPAGTLNATNDIARYRLPSNLHLTDQQMETINTTVNGVANQYVSLDTLEITDTEKYNTYLGIEATEGTRKPSDNVDEYFADHPDLEGQEYINAVVRAENVFDDTTGEYAGQDLVFTFSPYTVQKNQHEYDADGQPTKVGQKVDGWLCFDLHMDQIDWSEPVVSATDDSAESIAEILFAAKDTSLDISEISTSLRLVELNTIESEKDDIQEDQSRSADDSPDNDESKMTDPDTTEDSTSEEETSESDSADEATATADDKLESAVDVNAETYPPVSFEDTITVQAGTLSTDSASAAQNTPAETAITVSVIAEKETFPLGTTMQLGTVEDMDTVASAVEGTVEGQTRGFHAVDISFYNADGEEIEPLKPIKVSMTSEAIKQAVEDSSTAPVVVHIENPAETVTPAESENIASSDELNDLSANRTDADENSDNHDAHHDSVTETGENTPTATIVETVETSDTDSANASKDNTDTLTFDAGSFSVYAIVYTVDFHYEVNGKTYEFRIPGGGFISLEHLVEMLGIAKNDWNAADSGEVADFVTDETAININNSEVSETTKNFVSEVANVEFSSPELVWVGKAETETTVGGLKEANGLNVQYSVELTEEQIAEINESTVESGDWALISMLPFTSEESLTVTMKNGDQWIVKVTDAQKVEQSADLQVDVNSSYIICFEANGRYYVLKTDGTKEEFTTTSNFDKLGNDYKWSFYYIFREKDQLHNMDKEYYFIRPVGDKSMTLSLVDPGQALLQPGTNNVGVLPQEGGGFIFEGYTRNHEHDTHLYYNGTGFVGSADQSSVISIYKQDILPTFDYTVISDDYTMGSVQTTGTAQSITQTPEGGQPVTGTYYIAQSTNTGSNNDKKNASQIKAVPVNKAGENNTTKYSFDHWELDGQPLYERDANGEIVMQSGKKKYLGDTISAGTLNIPSNGSTLKAFFKINADYMPTDPKEKQGTDFDSMQAWLEELQERNIPLNEDGCKKTAEVYDYENRIYRVDLTAQSSLTTFDGTIDLGFVMDISKSMEFPATLTKYKDNIEIYKINDNATNKAKLSGDGPYYLIADEEQTATVFRLFKYNDQWYAMDASKYDKTKTVKQNAESSDSKIIGSEENKTSWIRDSKGQVYSDSNAKYFFHRGDGQSAKYRIYTDSTRPGVTRFDDLTDSMSATINAMKSLLGLLTIADQSSDDPDVKIAWTVFHGKTPDSQAANDYKDTSLPHEYSFKSSSSFSQTDINKIINITSKADGGTSTDVAMTDVQHNFNWDNTSKRYVVLITDGAPQKGGKEIANSIVIDAANNLRNEDNVKIITVGLSMGNVDRGRVLLYDMADEVNGERAFYSAEGDNLRDVLLHILKTIMDDAITVGKVTDKINEAFYPVDKATGRPLKAGERIDLNGNKVDDAYSGACGTLQEDGMTIVWTNQDFTWDGWQGTVYVKAKEDYLGGNGLITNDGPAEIEAQAYKIRKGDTPIPLKSTSTNPHYNRFASLESPRVNVNELSFTGNNTAWTVYAGNEVDPKSQIKALFEEIKVEEVVTKAEDTAGDGLPDKVKYDTADTDNNYYPLTESFSDQRESEATEGEERFTFTMNELFKKLLDELKTKGTEYSWWDYSANEIKPAAFITAAKAAGGITIPYDVYGITTDRSIHPEYNTINITLQPAVKTGEQGLDTSPHPAAVLGDAVEKYTLTVLYTPDYDALPRGQGGKNTADFHVGTYGTLFQGHGAGTETSTNNHSINVFAKPLDALKTDESDTPLPGAVFKLYRAFKTGDSQPAETLTAYDADLTGSYICVATATSGADGIAHIVSINEHTTAANCILPGETYYLIETAAPTVTEGTQTTTYERDRMVREVTVETEDTLTDLTSEAITEKLYPYNWTQTAKLKINAEELSQDQIKIINKEDKITINVEKQWEGTDTPPDSIKIKLYRTATIEHDWDNGQITAGSCTEGGKIVYTCHRCGETREEVLPATGHIPSEPVMENEVAATCLTDGSYDQVIRCSVCGEEISREHVVVPALGHEWGDWEVTTPATEDREGVETRTCRNDPAHTETRSIPKLQKTAVVTYRVYQSSMNGYVYADGGSSGRLPVGSVIELTWSDSGFGSGNPAIVYTNAIRSEQDTWSGRVYSFSGGTSKNVSGTYSSWTYHYSTQVTVTENMVLDICLKSDYFLAPEPGAVTISLVSEPGRSSSSPASANGRLKASSAQQAEAATNTSDDAPQTGTGSRAPEVRRSGTQAMTAAQLQTLLGTFTRKETASVQCGVSVIEQIGEEYTITPDGNQEWKWSKDGLNRFDEYGNEYTYYVVETDPTTGFETTYLGQNAGLQDDDTVRIINELKAGQLKITKYVQYNGQAPQTQIQKSKLAGTYTFTIYTDAQCQQPYQETEGVDKTVSITIEDDGSSRSSELITLPEGDYWIHEDVPENDTYALADVVQVHVTAGAVNEQAVIAAFTNNINEGEDPTHIKVRKTFAGIDQSEIPQDFSVTVTDGTNTYVLTRNPSQSGISCNVSEDGLMWTWTIHNVIPGTTYTITEDNADISGYTLETTGVGESQTITKADITYTIGHRETKCSQQVWPVNENTLFAASMTNKTGGKGSLIISRYRLSESERKAVEETLLPKLREADSNVWKMPVHYYSVQENPTGFNINAGVVTYDTTSQTITLSDTSIWQHVASVSFVKNEPENGDFNIANTYTGIPVELEIVKVEEGNEDKKLGGAVFTVREIADKAGTGNGTYETAEGASLMASEPTNDTTGKTSFTGLMRGYYELKEKTAPNGYVTLNDRAIYFKVSGGAISWLEKGDGKPSTWPEKTNDSMVTFTAAVAEDASNQIKAQNAAFMIENTPGAALPNTGGPGPNLMYLLGLLLTSFAGTGILMKKRRRKAA